MNYAPLSTRLLFLLRKYRALCMLLVSKKATLKVGYNRFFIDSISEIGTIHSSLIDFYDDIIASSLFDKNAELKIIDVGANIGQFSNAALFFFPKATIVAFEPDKDVYEKFCKNINTEKSSVIIHNYGLGAKASTKTFYRTQLSGMSSFVSPETHNLVSQQKLRIKSLDSFAIEDIDLLKIDVEGYEYEVLSGASNTMQSSNYLLIEISLNRSGANNNISILKFIAQQSPNAQIIKFGRPLGSVGAPECQDVLLNIKSVKG